MIELLLRDKETDIGLTTRLSRNGGTNMQVRRRTWGPCLDMNACGGCSVLLSITNHLKHEGGRGPLRVARGRGGSKADGGGSLAAGGLKAQGGELMIATPLKGSAVRSHPSFPFSHLLMLIFITLRKILIIN